MPKKIKVQVGVSNRHVHLTEEVYNKLFSYPLEKRSDLKQKGEYASQQTVMIKTENSSIPNVRILGPFRNYNQVEISKSDAYKLGINPPIRQSGDLFNSATITLVSAENEITLPNSCIINKRHVHISPEKAAKLNLKNNQQVKILVTGDKSCLLDALVKISDNAYLEVHLDIDDANAAALKNGDKVEIII